MNQLAKHLFGVALVVLACLGNVRSLSAGLIYWADKSDQSIKRASLDGSNIETVVSNAFANEIALDRGANKIYWTDTNGQRIRRANLNGTGIEDLVTSADGLVRPREIVVEPLSGRIYWVDQGPQKIQSANLNGSGIVDLVTGLHEPFGIDLDAANNKMYWTEGTTSSTGNDKVQRSNLDGSDVETLLFSGGTGLHGIALDLQNDQFYFPTNLPSSNTIIRRADFDGTNLQLLLTGGVPTDYRSIDLDVAGGKMYFNDLTTDTIFRANLDGTSMEAIVSSGLPSGIALDLAVPEPSTYAMAVLGLLGLALFGWRRKRNTQTGRTKCHQEC